MTVVTQKIRTPTGGIIPPAAWDMLFKKSVTNEATVDILGFTDEYFIYEFRWNNFVPITDESDLLIRVTSDNGATWDQGASDYATTFHEIRAVGGSSPVHGPPSGHTDGANTRIQVCRSSTLHATAQGGNFQIILFNPAAATSITKMRWEGNHYQDEAGAINNNIWISGAGVRNAASAVNGIQFFCDSGNIANGVIWGYGLRA